MLVTEAGIVNDVRSVCQKASFPIVVIPEPNSNEVKADPLKAY